MEPLSLLGILAQITLKYGPDVAAWWRATFEKGTIPTADEWATLTGLIGKSGQSYFDAPAPAVFPSSLNTGLDVVGSNAK